MRCSGDDVLITGIGCVGPFGVDRESFWERLLAGDRAVRRLSAADCHGLGLGSHDRFQFVGAPAFTPAGDVFVEPVLRLISAAASEAVSHARLSADSYSPDRAGCVIGTSKGGLTAFSQALAAERRREPNDAWLEVMPHVASSVISRTYGLRAACLAPVAACATGLVSVLRAFDLIQSDLCDVVIAGSGDASLHPAVLASFKRMGVLATRFPEPAAACRPFNRDRDGFAIGEGAAVFVLERRDHAERRGAEGVARVLGGAVLSDPCGMTDVDPTGASPSRAITDTLARCGVTPQNIGHVNLHGTATRSNDVAEASALRIAFGAFADRVPCVALKGAIGHQLGAAGATELAVTALSIRDGMLPPTVNLDDPDPKCALSLTREPCAVSGLGLKLSLGFGGHVAVALLGPA
ncbi:MAG: beta-ketoacyl-[acyl-carrier-protein] synthase family protein [Planctomycetota bacterium]|nr:beta-ketoacyl-[acyl-carrier-protein] synthase family protein [Planctomycetaceae bacterium]MDQ3330033.1 beta-ketoacyl-[acyl-carrier-protein] synthase family protein [Planctomycetota bacterium]